jgi:hypothetical protein
MKLTRIPWIVLACFGCATASVSPQPAATPTPTSSASPPGSARQVVFVSDMHLGPGRDSNGHWYKIEDFRWDGEFAKFLDRVNADGGGKTDLVLLGDSVELWQSIAEDCIYPDRNLGCSEADTLTRLGRITAAHKATLENLGKFADDRDNRVYVVPGNHDGALLFPKASAALLAAIGSKKAGRVVFRSDGRWMSPDHLILAEHGHQIGKEVNRFDGWPTPFIDDHGVKYLQRVWGEQFVQKYYNQFEVEYPIIDNILEEGVGIRYAMKEKGTLKSAGSIAKFVGFLVTKMSSAQFSQLLGDEGKPPEWDVAAERARGAQFFLDSLPPDDPSRPEVEAQIRAGTVQISDLSDDDIREICDARAALGAPLAPGEKRLFTPPPQCAKKTLGAIGQGLLGPTLRKRIAEYVRTVSDQSAVAGGAAPPFALFVYGHTHSADSGFDVGRDDGLEWRMRVVNTGAWQRVISPKDLEQFRCSRPESEIIRLEPDALPAWYTAVVVRPYAAKPEAKLKYWVRRSDGTWDFADQSPALPDCPKPTPTPVPH